MRLTEGLFLLVAASAVAVAATSLFMNAFPRNGTALADAGEPVETTRPALTPQHARSILFRFYKEYRRRAGPRSSPRSEEDDLAAYAAECEEATGITIPDFSCLDGEEVPNQKMTSEGLCNAPNVLNGECDPGSHFQVLNGSTPDAVAVAHCRKVGLPRNQPRGKDFFNDIAIVQYNKRNGAICFYQALSTEDVVKLPGSNIPSPSKGIDAPWRDGMPHWMTPTATEAVGCTGCHDNGGFVRSPYIIGTKTQKLPSKKEGFDNNTIPLRYVGAAFSQNRSWSITSNNDADNCTQCHRLGVSNHPRVSDAAADATKPQLGSALSFSIISTAAQQTNKRKHSKESPIWMVPPQVLYDSTNDEMAGHYVDCAVDFALNNFQGPVENCQFTLFACPLTDSPDCAEFE
jgi:hypothetical protein